MDILTIIFFVVIISAIIAWAIVHTVKKHKENKEESCSGSSIDCDCSQTIVEPTITKLVTIKNQDGTRVIYRAKRKSTNHGNYNDYDFYDEFDNLILTIWHMEMLYNFVESEDYLNEAEFDLFQSVEETAEDFDDQEVIADQEIANEVEEQVIETEVEEQVSSEMFDNSEVEYAQEPTYTPEPTYEPEPTYRSEPTDYGSSSSDDSYSSSDSDDGGGGDD